jgi:hypothetical protein
MRIRERIKLTGSTWTLDSRQDGGLSLAVLDQSDDRSQESGVVGLRVTAEALSALVIALGTHGYHDIPDTWGDWRVERTGIKNAGPTAPEWARVAFTHHWGNRTILAVRVGGHEIARLASFLSNRPAPVPKEEK